jgi:hypothetical protein
MGRYPLTVTGHGLSATCAHCVRCYRSNSVSCSNIIIDRVKVTGPLAAHIPQSSDGIWDPYCCTQSGHSKPTLAWRSTFPVLHCLVLLCPYVPSYKLKPVDHVWHCQLSGNTSYRNYGSHDHKVTLMFCNATISLIFLKSLQSLFDVLTSIVKRN